MNTKLNLLKDECLRYWQIFKELHPDSEYFKIYIDLIGEQLNKIWSMDDKYNPYWFTAYERHSEKYWNKMRVHVEKQLSKMEYDTAIELQANDLDIYFAFNRTCVPVKEFKEKNVVCEFILN